MNKSLTRRIIAIMGTACFFGVATYLSIKGDGGAFDALKIAGSLILGFYFGFTIAKNGSEQ